MVRFMVIVTLFAILLSPVFAPASPQQSTQAGKLAARTNVVLVPVVVTDKQGNHIKGLKKEDFEVKEDGKLQNLASFEEINADATPVQRAALPPNSFSNQLVEDRPKELEIVVLDLLNTPFTFQAQAKQGLIEFLTKSTSQNALLSLIVLYANHINLVHNFTSDPSILVSAIKKLETRFTSRDTSAMNVRGDDDFEAAQLDAIFSGADLPSAVGGDLNAQMAAARAQGLAISARLDASRQSQEGMMTLESLQQIAQYYATVPGRKSLVWATSGFKFNIGSMTGEATRGTSLDDWQRTIRALQDANISVYPVDVSGLLTHAPNTQIAVNMPVPTSSPEGGVAARGAAMEAVEQGMFQNPEEAKHETFRQMADRTGGKPYYNNNDLEDLFRRATLDSAQYYLLTYTTGESGKNGWRKIEVKVHQAGAQVRSRTGYFFTKSEKDLDASRTNDELLALSSALNFTAVPLSGTWQQFEPAGAARKAHFILSIPPGGATIDTEHENHVSLDILVVALDSKGKDAGKVTQRIDTKLAPAALAQVQAHGIGYAQVLTLPPGQYVVHFAVRDNLTGKVGSIVTPLKVE